MRVRSILAEIPHFDIIWSLDCDYMHCVLLGVCRQFCKLWFDPSYHHENFYMGRNIQLVDDLLTALKPTREISRTPRKMSDRKHWKAHEWLSWLLIYSLPIMKEMFPSNMVQHWGLLVDAVAILIKKGATKSEIYFAEISLIKFIRQTEDIYGLNQVSFNVHLLSHLPRSVINWGPLFAHSAFAFENKNFELQRFVKSSHGVCLQICNFYRLKFFKSKLEKLCDKDLTQKEKFFLEKLNRNKAHSSVKIENTVIFGKCENLNLTKEHYMAFQRGHISVKKDETAKFFKKAFVNNQIIESSSYKKTRKRNNSFCLTQENQVFGIEIFAEINSSCFALGHFYEVNNSPILPPPRKLKHLLQLGRKDEFLAVIKTSAIQEKVIVVMIGEKIIVATWPGLNDMTT